MSDADTYGVIESGIGLVEGRYNVRQKYTRCPRRP
jgi:hypothetical protein